MPLLADRAPSAWRRLWQGSEHDSWVFNIDLTACNNCIVYSDATINNQYNNNQCYDIHSIISQCVYMRVRWRGQQLLSHTKNRQQLGLKRKFKFYAILIKLTINLPITYLTCWLNLSVCLNMTLKRKSHSKQILMTSINQSEDLIYLRQSHEHYSQSWDSICAWDHWWWRRSSVTLGRCDTNQRSSLALQTAVRSIKTTRIADLHRPYK